MAASFYEKTQVIWTNEVDTKFKHRITHQKFINNYSLYEKKIFIYLFFSKDLSLKC